MKFTSYLRQSIRENPPQTLKGTGNLMHLAAPVLIFTLGEHSQEGIDLLKQTLLTHLDQKEAVSITDVHDLLPLPDAEDDTEPEKRISLKNRQFYENLPENSLKEQLSKLADRLHNTWGDLYFEGKSTVQIVLLVRAEQAGAGCLRSFSRAVKECFSPYFMNQCLIHTCIFLDQRAYFDNTANDRYASMYLTLKEADLLKKDHLLTSLFVLSNMNSREVMDEENVREAYQAVAYMILGTAEDSVWKSRDRGLNLTIFQEIIDNANLGNDVEGGCFYSLGYRHLEQDHELIVKSACAGVLQELTDKEENKSLSQSWLENEIKKCSADTCSPARDLGKIARDMRLEEAQLHASTVGNAIRRMYGHHLELYYQLNMPFGKPLEAMVRAGCKNIAAKVRQTILSGGATLFEAEQYYEQLIGYCEGLSKNCEEQQMQFEADIKKLGSMNYSSYAMGLGRRRNGSTLDTVTAGFMEVLRKVYTARYRRQMMLNFIRELNYLLGKYRQYTSCIEAAQEDLERELNMVLSVARKDPQRRPQQAYADVYYISETRELCRKSSAYRKLIQDISLYAEEDAAFQEEKLYDLVDAFVRNSLLPQKLYHQDYLEEIVSRMEGSDEDPSYRLVTPSDVYDQTLGDIDVCRHYLCKAVFGSARQQDIMVFFQNREDTFVLSENHDNHAINEIRAEKLRISPDAGNPALDVLFVAGNIGLEGIYLFDRYRSAWENAQIKE